VGNLKTIGDNAVCQQQNFNYDEQNRLTNANTQNNCGNSTPGYSIATNYDNLGNLTHKDGVGDYHYDPNHAHQLANVTGTNYSNCGYGYDSNGNVGYGGCRNYSWNYENHFVSNFIIHGNQNGV